MNLGRRAVRGATCDGRADIPRPGHESFEEIVAILDTIEARFKRLKDDPDPTAKEGDRPSKNNQKNKPKQGKTGIST